MWETVSNFAYSLGPKILLYAVAGGVAIKFLLSRILFSFYLEGDWAIEFKHYHHGQQVKGAVLTRCELVVVGQRPAFQTKGILIFIKLYDGVDEVLRGINSLEKIPYTDHFLIPRSKIPFDLVFVREFTKNSSTGEFTCKPEILPMECRVTHRWLSSRMNVEVKLQEGYFLRGTAQKLIRTILGYIHQ